MSAHIPMQTSRHASLVLALLAAASVAACTAMPATQSGFLAGQPALVFSEDGSVGRHSGPYAIDTGRVAIGEIRWAAADAFDAEDREALGNSLRQALSTAAAAGRPRAGGRPVVVRAAITRVETVSPVLNVVITLAVFAPLDRGGAAVELEAIDAETGQPLASMSHAHYAPISKLGARFSRLGSAEAAFERAAQEFCNQLAAAPATPAAAQ